MQYRGNRATDIFLVSILLVASVAGQAMRPAMSVPWESGNAQAGRQAVADYANSIADLADEVAEDMEGDHYFDAKKLDAKIKEKSAELRSEAFKPVNAATDELIDDTGKIGGPEGAQAFHDFAKGYRSGAGGIFAGNQWLLLGAIAILSILCLYLGGVALYVNQHGDPKALRWFDDIGTPSSNFEATRKAAAARVAKVTAELDKARAEMAGIIAPTPNPPHLEPTAPLPNDHGVTLETVKTVETIKAP